MKPSWAKPAILLTCEHGGARVPAAYRQLFTNHKTLLTGHAGSDIGALGAARQLSRQLPAPLIAATTTRLLIDLNRSPTHPKVWSAISRPLSPAVRKTIMLQHYLPYRSEVDNALAALIRRHGRVVHISVHSFTDILQGQQRNADLGFLYDPGRRPEASLCRTLAKEMKQRQPELRVRRNYPYRGTADGLITALRRKYSAGTYIGLELELNQQLFAHRSMWQRIVRNLATTLQKQVHG